MRLHYAVQYGGGDGVAANAADVVGVISITDVVSRVDAQKQQGVRR